MADPTVVRTGGRRELRFGPLRAAHVATALIHGETHDIPIAHVDGAGDALILAGRAHDVAARATWRRDGPLWSIELELYCDDETDVRWRLDLEVAGASQRWMAPGLMYEPGAPPASRAPGPRSGMHRGGAEQWRFRSDRLATPVAIRWGEAECVALAVEPHGPWGPNGLSYDTTPGRERLAVLAPFEDDARLASATPHRASATMRVREARVRAWAYVGAGDRDAHAIVLRTLYERLRGDALAPRVPVRDAAALAAEGLERWHYRTVNGVPLLAETASFDRDAPRDRENMHVAWLSGAPAAFALLTHSGAASATARDAARRVLDTVASGLAPCGAFWGEWRADRGWSAGWNGDPRLLHARTLAEATLFMARAIAVERDAGASSPRWEAAVRANCAAALRAQLPGGAFGTHWDAQTGSVAEPDGTSGVLWAAALLEADRVLGIDGAAAAARRAGEAYAANVVDGRLYGAPEDVHLAPSSEDGYCALMAYAALHERDGRGEWLDLARRAADWTMTFRYSYDVAFEPGTALGALGFRTRGLDQASPSNQHVHVYGLVCLPELVAVARALGDEHLLDRARDHLLAATQTVCRSDGDLGGRRGMVAERFLQTVYGGPKGAILPDSHAWAAGLLCYAATWARQHREALPI